MSDIPAGFFVDWDGNVRRTEDCGGGYRCEVDLASKYVALYGKYNTLAHEATYYKDEAAIAKAGIKGTLVPGSHPWGRKDEGF